MDRHPESHSAEPIENIPEPLYSNSESFVENVYKDSLSLGAPDLESQENTTEYLITRMQQRPSPVSTRIVLTPSGRHLPQLVREEVATKPSRRLERTNDWAIRPRTAIAVWASSLVLFNAMPLLEDAHEEASVITNDIGNAMGFEPNGSYVDGLRLTPQVMPPILVKKHVSAANLPGSASVNNTELRSFRRSVERVAKPGAELNIHVTALSSDDYDTDASIGKREPASEDMSDERKITWGEAVQKEFPDVPVTASAHQEVLTARQVRKLNRLALKAGFAGENPMIAAVNADKSTPALRRFVGKYFKRGVDLRATIQNPATTKFVPSTYRQFVPAINTAPKNPGHNYYPFFVPLPWFKRRRWVEMGEQSVKKWRIKPGKEILRPELLHETADQAWLRLRPEAVTEAGNLVDDAWAYTQKYEHLMRDGRIREVLRADITDGTGAESALRIFFVDHKPKPETVTAYSDLLRSFAAMRTPDGQTVADSVTGIFVFPSSSAGRKSRNPKMISLGIDEQYDADIEGIMYYPLKLVELHMPTKLKGAALQTYLNNYAGSVWTMAHEVAGHGTDVAAEPLTLRRVYSRHVKNAFVLDGEHRAQRLSTLQPELVNLDEKSHDDDKRRFDISYTVLDTNGQPVNITTRVNEGDERLSHALSATIVGRKHTQYAAENPSEHYAELAGAATGITVDFEEAGITPQLHGASAGSASFTTGFHPDEKAQTEYAELVGAVSKDKQLHFTDGPDVSIVSCRPEDDPLLRHHMIRSRLARMLRPHELLAILTDTSRRIR